MKILYILTFTFLISMLRLSGQTNYYSLTTEKLTLLKVEAVKNADYTKAADIKKIIDKRQEEDAKLVSLKTDIDKRVKAEDFQGAGILQEELKKLTETKRRKEELRASIAKATAEENYTKASSDLIELRVLEGLDEPIADKKPEPVIKPEPVLPNQKKEPVFNNYKEPEPGRQHKTLLAYSPGSYAPIGLMVGMISQKGINLIGSIRMNTNNFVTVDDDAKIDGGVITDTYYNWAYTNYAYYSYISYSLGVGIKVFGDLNKISGHFLPTIGISRYKYIYEYNKIGKLKETVNVLDKDQSGYNLNISPNFLLNLKLFNVHLGAEIGLPSIKQSNFVFGAGFAF